MAGSTKFGGYTLRAIEESDRERIENWIAADPVHAGLFNFDFFMDPRITGLVIEDAEGPLMFVRLSRSSRVHIQFPPEGDLMDARAVHQQRQTVTNALILGMAFLEACLIDVNCCEWIFESESDSLRALVQKRMGFQPSPNELVRTMRNPKEA